MLGAELVLIFVGLPMLFDRLLRQPRFRRALFPALWLLAASSLWLLHSSGHDLSQLWTLPWRHEHTPVVLLRWLVLGGVLAVLSWWLARDSFLYLPRHSPGLWLIVLVFYPLLSVLPQGLVWRVFFVARYQPLFQGAPDWVLLGVGAVAFAFAHIIFRNAIALSATAVGGVLFLHTYLATDSMLLASLEHALYGLTAFSLGLGRFLYLGATRATAALPAPASDRAT